MKLLVVMYGINGGGAEKSLVSFLTTLEMKYGSDIDVDLLLFRPEGLFFNQIPKNCNRLTKPKEVFMMSYSPSEKMFWSNISLKGIAGKTAHYICRIKKRNGQLSDIQAMWNHWKPYIPSVKKHYDVAISYMHGVTNYFVIDKCDADKKYLYVHHDYEKMNENAQYDYSYFKKADAIITVSPRCIQSVVNVHPKLKGKVVCIENIHSEALIKKMPMSGTAHEFDNKENYVKIVSIGRITNVKRFDRAVEAAKILKDSGIKFIWLLLGCGDLENKIKELIKKLGLEREFVLVGVKTNPYPYINNADIFVQTSDNEGKSMVIDEAKILKKPIVVTNYKTVSDVIKDGEDGIVADFTPESVAEKLMMIINDKSLKDKIISNLECEIIGNENEIEKYISLWRK